MKIVIAPSGFKECMQADEVADGIEEGVQRVLSDAQIVKVPLVDGGEGPRRRSSTPPAASSASSR